MLLDEAARVRGCAVTIVKGIENLCLRLEIEPPKKRPEQVLGCHTRQDLLRSARVGRAWRVWFEARASRGQDTETRENGRISYRPRSKIVRAVGVNAAVLAAGFYGVTAAHPGNVVPGRERSGVPRPAPL